MAQRILVPIDGSRTALTALTPALSIAERSGATVYLVTAVGTVPGVTLRDSQPAGPPGGAADPERPGGPGHRPTDLRSAPTEGWFEEERKRAQNYLNEVSTGLADTSVPIQVRIGAGRPVPTLEEAIEELDIDLVVMTSHGRGALERLWIGSVAEGLIRSGPCPILLWRPRKDDTEVDFAARVDFKRILLPLDGSENSEAVLPAARSLAGHFGASIQLLSVIPEPTRFPSSYIPHQAEEEQERTGKSDEFMRYLETVAEGIRGPEITIDLLVLEENEPAEAILAQSEAEGVDLIAMSTRGRGGVARLITGSVADKVVRGGSVPVLIHRS